MGKPLLLLHRRKLIIGSTVLAVSALLALFPDTVSRLIGISTWSVELVGAIVFIVLLYWLAHGLVCGPQARGLLGVFPRQITTQPEAVILGRSTRRRAGT